MEPAAPWAYLSEFRPEQAGIGPGKEQIDTQAIWCELVAMAARNSLNDAVKAEAAKIVGQFSGGLIGGIQAQQLRHEKTHFRIGEPAELKTEYDQHSEQSLDAFVTEPQSRCSLIRLDPNEGTVPRLQAEIPLCRQRPNGHRTGQFTGFAVVPVLDRRPLGDYSRTVHLVVVWAHFWRAK
jgi:hypothetical protein